MHGTASVVYIYSKFHLKSKFRENVLPPLECSTLAPEIWSEPLPLHILQVRKEMFYWTSPTPSRIQTHIHSSHSFSSTHFLPGLNVSDDAFIVFYFSDDGLFIGSKGINLGFVVSYS